VNHQHVTSAARTRWRITPLLTLLAGALYAGCGGPQSPLEPAGPYARSIANHWWLMLALGSVVFVVVFAFFIRALTVPRNPHSVGKDPADAGEDHGTTRLKSLVVAGSVGITIVILLVVMVQAIWVSRETQRSSPSGPVEIEITGRQWWWEIRYLHERADLQFITANELHIPVGEPVLLKLHSADVIHSFWVPNLQGKVDMIPGRQNELRIMADRAGEWRGQCAEFCGLQHAHMALVLVARPRAEFERWWEEQLRPASPPADSLALAGERVFRAAQCAFCHNVTGTGATARAGPDLTRIASRLTLAAGTVPNNRGNMAGWILDPHGIKPGVFMPPTPLEQAELHALLHYLGTLR
jgi:cytochrome c oxidase subunit II